MTDTIPFTTEERGVWRRFWPLFVLGLGLVFAVVASEIAAFVSDRIVLFGPVNAIVLVGLCAVGALWCLAASLVGSVWKLFGGSTPGMVVATAATVVVLMGAFVLTVFVGFGTTLKADRGPRYELNVPGTSAEYFATTTTFGETTVTVYKGDGRVFEQLALTPPAPFVNRSMNFGASYRVETNQAGQSFLVYPQESGGDARVLLR